MPFGVAVFEAEVGVREAMAAVDRAQGTNKLREWLAEAALDGCAPPACAGLPKRKAADPEATIGPQRARLG